MRYVVAFPLVALSLVGSASLPECANAQSNPYRLDRLFLMPSDEQPMYQIQSFTTEKEVANYYGATSYQAHLASDFFSGCNSCSATMLFTRYPEQGARAHLYGADISNMTLQQLRAINGSLSITSQGYGYAASVNLAGVSSFRAAATAMTNALNQNLPQVATVTRSSIMPVWVNFTGSISNIVLDVTAVSSGSIRIGSIVSGPGVPANTQIISQLGGTPNGVGTYALFIGEGQVSAETMKASYGLLTIGSASGTVAVGQQVIGAGVVPLTAIEGNLSGSGAGSTWLVNYSQTVPDENMTMTGAPLDVKYNSIKGATANRAYFSIQQDDNFLWNSSSLSYASGAVATSLGLTQADGAFDSSPGAIVTSAATWMNNFIADNPNNHFYSFQSGYRTKSDVPPEERAALSAWAQSTGGSYTYLAGWSANTPPISQSINSAAAPVPPPPD